MKNNQIIYDPHIEEIDDVTSKLSNSVENLNSVLSTNVTNGFPFSVFVKDYTSLKQCGIYSLQSLRLENSNTKRPIIYWEPIPQQGEIKSYTILVAKNSKDIQSYERNPHINYFTFPFDVQAGNRYEILVKVNIKTIGEYDLPIQLEIDNSGETVSAFSVDYDDDLIVNTGGTYTSLEIKTADETFDIDYDNDQIINKDSVAIDRSLYTGETHCYKCNSLIVNTYTNVQSRYSTSEVFFTKKEVCVEINTVINDVKNVYSLTDVKIEDTELGLKLAWQLDNKKGLIGYNIIYNLEGVASKHRTVIELGAKNNVYYLKDLDKSKQYCIAIVPVITNLGRQINQTNMFLVSFNTPPVSESEVLEEGLQKYINVLPEFLRDDDNVLRETVTLISKYTSEIESQSFSKFNIETIYKEFKLNSEVFSKYFYNIEHPELLKSLFSFKGTFSDLEYALKRVGRYDTKIVEMADADSPMPVMKCPSIWEIDNISPKHINNRNPLEIYHPMYDVITNALINNSLPWDINNKDTDILIVWQKDGDCPNYFDCGLKTEIGINLDAPEFVGYNPEELYTTLQNILSSRLYICVVLKALIMRLITKDIFDKDVLDKALYSTEREIQDIFDYLIMDKSKYSIFTLHKDIVYDCGYECKVIEPWCIDNAEPITIMYNDKGVEGIIVPEVGYTFTQCALESLRIMGEELGFDIDQRFPTLIEPLTQEIIANAEIIYMPCGPSEKNVDYISEVSLKDTVNLGIEDCRFASYEKPVNEVDNSSPYNINDGLTYIRNAGERGTLYCFPNYSVEQTLKSEVLNNIDDTKVQYIVQENGVKTIIKVG